MTIDEAIKQTENVICLSRMAFGNVFQVNNDYWDTVLNALREKKKDEENDELSVCELRMMNGCPIWVESLTGEFSPCWMLVDTSEGQAVTDKEFLELTSYGESWVAYPKIRKNQ